MLACQDSYAASFGRGTWRIVLVAGTPRYNPQVVSDLQALSNTRHSTTSSSPRSITSRAKIRVRGTGGLRASLTSSAQIDTFAT
jgi:hypothetical protein